MALRAAEPLHQGRFVGRPSELWVRPEGSPAGIRSVHVGGNVAFVGSGNLDIVPGDGEVGPSVLGGGAMR